MRTWHAAALLRALVFYVLRAPLLDRGGQTHGMETVQPLDLIAAMSGASRDVVGITHHVLLEKCCLLLRGLLRVRGGRHRAIFEGTDLLSRAGGDCEV